ncbi:hypothetical protein JCM1840_002588 [Sporobolomyces johnsonii]
MADTAGSQSSADVACVFEAEELLSPEDYLRQLDDLARQYVTAFERRDPASETLWRRLESFGFYTKMYLPNQCFGYESRRNNLSDEEDMRWFAVLGPSLARTTRRVLSRPHIKLELRLLRVDSHAIVRLDGHSGFAKDLFDAPRATHSQGPESFQRAASMLAAATTGTIRVYAPGLVVSTAMVRADEPGQCHAILVYESGAFLSGTKMCEMGLSRF